MEGWVLWSMSLPRYAGEVRDTQGSVALSILECVEVSNGKMKMARPLTNMFATDFPKFTFEYEHNKVYHFVTCCILTCICKQTDKYTQSF